MKSMLLGFGLFILVFGGIVAFGGGLPAVLFDPSDNVAQREIIAAPQPVTLGDYGDAVEEAYAQMLIACTVEDRKAYGYAMNALAVAKRHADSGKIERGNIGDRAFKLTEQFVEAVRKGIITKDHVPFGSLRSVIASVHKNATDRARQAEPMTFTLRGSIAEAAAIDHNDCQVL